MLKLRKCIPWIVVFSVLIFLYGFAGYVQYTGHVSMKERRVLNEKRWDTSELEFEEFPDNMKYAYPKEEGRPDNWHDHYGEQQHRSRLFALEVEDDQWILSRNGWH